MSFSSDNKNESFPAKTTPENTGSTRCFWIGYLIGGILGAGLGLLMDDLIGWVYMSGTVGCIAAITFDSTSS